MKQNEIFKAREGDAWYRRNASYLTDVLRREDDVPLQLIARARLSPKRILEVGASNGFRLSELKRRYKATCIGLEPSKEAIAEGRRLFPRVRFVRGTADALPFKDVSFDLVIVNFVLHWIDRPDLLKTLSEIDRVLADGGRLLIGDFLPDKPGRFAYKHLPRNSIFTFTQDYAKILASSELYRVVSRIVADHATKRFARSIPPDRRIAYTLLRKNLLDAYEERTL
jgi:ubiquinone/menaquinone biosynthesis C-methylase UbiE